MQDLYNNVSKTADQTVHDRWCECLAQAIKQRKPLWEIRCELNFQPSQAAIKALETDQIKLMLEYNPSFYSKDEYFLDTYNPECWVLRIKPPSVDYVQSLKETLASWFK